jgi:hypothetical protein
VLRLGLGKRPIWINSREGEAGLKFLAERPTIKAIAIDADYPLIYFLRDSSPRASLMDRSSVVIPDTLRCEPLGMKLAVVWWPGAVGVPRRSKSSGRGFYATPRVKGPD